MSTDWKYIALCGASSGLTGYGLAKLFIPAADTQTFIGGYMIPVAAGYGLVIATSSVISDLVGGYILPVAVKDKNLDYILQTAGKPILSGGLTLGLYAILAPEELRSNALKTFVVGASASMIGSYATKSFLMPMYK